MILERIRKRVGRSQLATNEEGMTTVEYVIILILIAVLAIGVWRKFGNAVRDKVNDSTDEVNTM